MLVLGAGGGVDVLQALALGARRVDAVELDPQRLRCVRDRLRGVTPASCIAIRACACIVAEPRAFVRASARRATT